MREDWKYSTIGESCNINYGTRVVRKRDGGTIYDVYGGGGATFKMDTYNRENCLVVSRFAMSPKCTRFVSGKFFLNDSGLTLSPKEDSGLSEVFMNTILLANNDNIYEYGRGSAQRNLKVDEFCTMPIAYPKSLSEQERIVSLLDTQFAKIDALKANAASQLQAAKDLFQAALKQLLAPKEGWEIKTLGEIVNIKRGLTYSKNDEVETSEKIVLRSNNVNLDNHQFDFTELKYLTPSFDIPADKYLQKGDLLMCMSNGSKAHLGKVALYDGESDKYAFGGFMAALSHKDSVIGRYLFYAMITPMYKEYIKTLSDGANINNLKVRDIESYSISFPPLPEQERIAARLDEISEKVNALQSNYDQTITLCNDLKQALLKSIFE